MKKVIQYGVYIACFVLGILALLFFRNGQNANQVIKEKEKQVRELKADNIVLEDNLKASFIRNRFYIDTLKNLKIHSDKVDKQIQVERNLNKWKIDKVKNYSKAQIDSVLNLIGDSTDMVILKLSYDSCSQMLSMERSRGLDKIIQAQDSLINNQDRIILDLKAEVTNYQDMVILKDEEIKVFKKSRRGIIWQRNLSIIGAGAIFTLWMLSK